MGAWTSGSMWMMSPLAEPRQEGRQEGRIYSFSFVGPPTIADKPNQVQLNVHYSFARCSPYYTYSTDFSSCITLTT